MKRLFVEGFHSLGLYCGSMCLLVGVQLRKHAVQAQRRAGTGALSKRGGFRRYHKRECCHKHGRARGRCCAGIRLGNALGGVGDAKQRDGLGQPLTRECGCPVKRPCIVTEAKSSLEASSSSLRAFSTLAAAETVVLRDLHGRQPLGDLLADQLFFRFSRRRPPRRRLLTASTASLGGAPTMGATSSTEDGARA